MHSSSSKHQYMAVFCCFLGGGRGGGGAAAAPAARIKTEINKRVVLTHVWDMFVLRVVCCFAFVLIGAAQLG